MPMAHHPAVAIIGQLVGITAEEPRNLGLHGLRQQRSRAVPQNLRQWVGKRSWLRQLDDIILGHGVSLLQWRSGGVEHPHDTPPYPFTPSPTSAHSSPASPEYVYRDQGWLGMGDWLGTGRPSRDQYRPFRNARAFVRRLGLKSEPEWREYSKSGKKP